MYMGFQPTIVLSGVSCLQEIQLYNVDGKYQTKPSSIGLESTT